MSDFKGTKMLAHQLRGLGEFFEPYADEIDALRAEVEEAEADAREAHKRTDRTIADWNKAQAEIAALRAQVEALQAKIKDYNDDCLSACVARGANGDCEAWTSRGMKCCDCPTDDMIEIDGTADKPPEGQT